VVDYQSFGRPCSLHLQEEVSRTWSGYRHKTGSTSGEWDPVRTNRKPGRMVPLTGPLWRNYVRLYILFFSLFYMCVHVQTALNSSGRWKLHGPPILWYPSKTHQVTTRNFIAVETSNFNSCSYKAKSSPVSGAAHSSGRFYLRVTSPERCHPFATGNRGGVVGCFTASFRLSYAGPHGPTGLWNTQMPLPTHLQLTILHHQAAEKAQSVHWLGIGKGRNVSSLPPRPDRLWDPPIAYTLCRRALSQGVLRLDRESDGSPPSRAEINNACRYTFITRTISWRGA
jgi:hypothetical protein